MFVCVDLVTTQTTLQIKGCKQFTVQNEECLKQVNATYKLKHNITAVCQENICYQGHGYLTVVSFICFSFLFSTPMEFFLTDNVFLGRFKKERVVRKLGAPAGIEPGTPKYKARIHGKTFLDIH